MISLDPTRRTILLLAATFALVLLVLGVIVATAVWRLTEWGSSTLDKVTDATLATVSRSREDATHVLQDAKGTLAAKVAAIALSDETTARSIEEAKTSIASVREHAAQVLAESDATFQRAAEAATQDASRTAAVAAGALAPIVSEYTGLVTRSLDAFAGRDPNPWPQDLPLDRMHVRQVGAVTEYTYEATGAVVPLTQLRQKLVDLGYTADVVAEGATSLEASYRGDRQLLLKEITRDGRQRIDVRETPLAVSERSEP